MTGLELCRAYYETCGRPALEEQFPEYLSKMAIGLAGEGSDCFGYDDEISRDHDWGPGFCIWVSEETYAEIGPRLEELYDSLPREFMGYGRQETARGKGRRGVMTISSFYQNLLGTDRYEEIDWNSVPDYALAAATNGQVFRDEEGTFSALREKLCMGYPEAVRYGKLARDAAMFSQTGQYNYLRMLKRGDRLTADRMLCDCIGYAMELQHHICRVYPPHDKWLLRSVERLDRGAELKELLDRLHHCLSLDSREAVRRGGELLEELGSFFAMELYALNDISDVDPYLDFQTEELLWRSGHVEMPREELVDRIVRLEFQAFDQVKNEGGRAYCQNDWPTFSIMRKSQYLTWNQDMLMQYLYDFEREFRQGHNLITEKYGRMMKSTAPERYRELEVHFPEISPEKQNVIEQIVALQMSMMEEFAAEHPKVAGNARNLHTYEDNIVDTSYETYLRGEISTYSDKMLQLYGSHVVACAAQGVNIARQTIENTARLYGYPDLDSFEAGI